MSNKTRYFVFSASGILAVGLTAGLVASYVGLPVAFSRQAGPDELQYIPAEAAVVAHADVSEILSSNFRERFRQFEPNTRDRDEFEQKTGINIDEDIHSVTASMVPEAPEGGGVLVIAKGRFEPARLEALVMEHGGQVEDYQGKRLLLHVKDNGTPDVALGFLDADLIAVGNSAALVKRAIDAGAAGRNVVSNNEMMRQITELESSNAWAVGRFDALANGGHLPSELRAHIPAIQWFSAATHINGGVSGIFKAEARDEAAAKNLRDMAQGFLALARMQADARPEIQTVVDSLQLSGDGKNIAVSFELPAELFDALQALHQKGAIRK